MALLPTTSYPICSHQGDLLLQDHPSKRFRHSRMANVQQLLAGGMVETQDMCAVLTTLCKALQLYFQKPCVFWPTEKTHIGLCFGSSRREVRDRVVVDVSLWAVNFFCFCFLFCSLPSGNDASVLAFGELTSFHVCECRWQFG